MTNPPPPSNWGPPQPPYGQGQPPNAPGQPQFGQGHWPPQQGWGQPPVAPKNNSLKWLLIGVAVLLVIAISVGATLLFTRDGGGGTTQTATGNPPAAGDIASANDAGPVSIITEDPTCGPWRAVANTLSKQQDQGWKERDVTVPATQWTAEQREMHESVAEAMRSAADEAIALAQLTPHRVVRELYEQSIAYWRAYAASIPTYTEVDNELAKVANASANTLVSLCAAIEQESASTRGPLVPPAEPPAASVASADPANPAMFISASSNSECSNWDRLQRTFEKEAAPWVNLDPSVPASNWTPEQRSSMDDMGRLMSDYADDLEASGRNSGNPVFEDFAVLSAVYWRAFVKAIPTYDPSDSYLSGTASSAGFIAFNGCAAVGS